MGGRCVSTPGPSRDWLDSRLRFVALEHEHTYANDDPETVIASAGLCTLRLTGRDDGLYFRARVANTLLGMRALSGIWDGTLTGADPTGSDRPTAETRPASGASPGPAAGNQSDGFPLRQGDLHPGRLRPTEAEHFRRTLRRRRGPHCQAGPTGGGRGVKSPGAADWGPPRPVPPSLGQVFRGGGKNGLKVGAVKMGKKPKTTTPPPSAPAGRAKSRRLWTEAMAMNRKWNGPRREALFQALSALDRSDPRPARP